MPKLATTSISRSSLKKRLGLIALLTLIVAAVAYPPPANTVIDWVNNAVGTHFGHLEKGFVLGLDLQGGTRLEYEADVSKVEVADRPGALSGVRDVIERRVNTLGVSEPLVQTAQVGNAWRVSVELAGIRDVNQAIKLIGETPILEFKEQNTDAPRSLTADEKTKLDADNAATLKRADMDLTNVLKNPGLLETLAKASSTDSASQALGGDLGFIKDKPEYQLLYSELGADATGTVKQLVELPSDYVIANILDKKDTGEKEIHAAHILIPYAGATEAAATVTSTKDQAKARAEDILKEVTTKNFTELAKKYSQEPGADQTGGDLGWFGKGDFNNPAFEDPAMALKVGEISKVVETSFGFHIIYKMDERPRYDVHVRAMFYHKIQESDIVPPHSDWKATQLSGKQLKRATVEFDQRTGVPQVSLQFDDEGSKLFADITKRNLNKQVAIFLDDEIISAPTVQSEITGGQAVITGSGSVAEAKTLAQRLQAGALPVPVKLIAQQSVGPTLGQDSVQKSLTAGLFGFLFITLFMLFWYRAPGFFAILSLALYVGISFTIFKVLPVTLTLSGIAGFILSLGIAVDANVLIFERLKEELREDKPYRTALEDAFKRAWPSIRDGNTTTLIACAVLYWFSSSVIKGFALTLAIGVIMSLFTAIVVTRNVLRFVTGTKWAQSMSWLFLDSKKHKDV